MKNRRAVLNEARRAAVIDAREQADVYADAAGLRLVEITDIADGNARPPISGEADLPVAHEGVRTLAILPPATLRFDASVQMRWRIAPR
ncbi:hypothetical protein GCM10010994_16080 [Chelatococcus reniformis]|uniref:Uncharacterized protein n=1 Tax=Chelatococcus reniformis TaxID=1494448 RepID=A0A916U373_9HYPH|nr:hypothetical protein GCM10010994_16080 [Chelatococcus reniformis]